jgi:signal transduction histidine kinase
LFEDSLVDALPLPACICEAPSGLIMRSNAQAIALWGQRPEPDTRIHDVLHFIRPDGARLPPDAFPLAAAIDEGIPEANRHAVIERRGQPNVLVRINILPLNTVGQRRAGLILFHGAADAVHQNDRVQRDSFAATLLRADLRSLLGGLAVGAALLSADAPIGEQGDKIRRHARASQWAVARMARLLNQLLDAADIDAAPDAGAGERPREGV